MVENLIRTTSQTEHLLSRASSQTRAAYCSLCALCVRSRLEIEQNKRELRESAAVSRPAHACAIV